MNPALILIDYTYDFVAPDGKLTRRALPRPLMKIWQPPSAKRLRRAAWSLW